MIHISTRSRVRSREPNLVFVRSLQRHLFPTGSRLVSLGCCRISIKTFGYRWQEHIDILKDHRLFLREVEATDLIDDVDAGLIKTAAE